ncbi:MAG TPA: hypothetical protein VIK28_08210 [Sedimentisphaerales bacterium]
MSQLSPDLETFFAIAGFAAIPIRVHSITVTLVGFVTSDDTASCGPQNSMVRSIMARYAANGSTFKAALSFR